MPTKKLLLILVGLALLCYLPFINNQFVWDDEQFIYSNAYVRNFEIVKIFTTSTTDGAGIISNYYRPLTTLSFAIDFQFWRNNPIGFHIPNMLLHAGAGVLLFLLLTKLNLPKVVSFCLSALFIIHPLQTEAVVYTNSRGDSLYTVFGLLTALCFVYFHQRKSLVLRLYEQSWKIRPNFLGFLSLVFYLCSILGKEIGIAILPLLCLIFVQQILTTAHKKIKKTAWSLFFMALVAATYLSLRATILNFDNSFDFYNDGSLYSARLDVRLLTFTKILWIYTQLMLFPYPLHMERDTKIVETWFSVFPLATVLIAVLLFWLGLKEYRLKKTIWIWFGATWFLMLLLPVSGIIAINGLLYEHWLYLPLVGFFLCLYGLLSLSKRKKIPDQLVKPILISVAIIFIFLTWRQNYLWGTPIRLYSHLLRYSDTARIHNNLAMAYAENQQPQLALLSYQKSLAISQSYPQTYYNMANLYLSLGKYSEALPLLKKATELSPNFELAQQKYQSLLQASASGTLRLE